MGKIKLSTTKREHWHPRRRREHPHGTWQRRPLWEREPSTTRPQALGRLEPMATGASLIRFLSLRLKPKAAPAPRSGRGPGAEAAGTGAAGAL